MEKKESKHNIKWIMILVAAVAACALVLVIVLANDNGRKLSQLLDLGKQYLENGEYENAIAAFDDALEIEAQNEEALHGMADSYLAWANEEVESAELDSAELDSAENLLKEGYQKTKDTRLSDRLLEIKTVVVNAGEPEPTTEEETETVKEVEEILELNSEDYENIGYASGGVLPVCKDSKWGAVNYSGVQIIPCEYDGFYAPNKDGYIVMINGSENAEYTLFDNAGKVVYQGTDHVVASNGFYIVARGQEENGLINTIIDYYHYDGDLVVSVDTQTPGDWGVSWEPHGFYDGLSIVERNMGDVVFFREDYSHSALMPFDVGFIDENGGVDWHDGDGYDETNSSMFMGEEEKQQAVIEEQRKAAEESSAYMGQAYGASGVTNESVPMNSLNHGYYFAYYEFSGRRVLRDKDRIVAEIMMDKITLQGDTLIYEKDTDSTSGNAIPIYGIHEGDYYDDNRILSYTSDGDYYYNFGSKILMYINGKYVLMDLLSSGDLKYDVFDYCAMNDEDYWLISSGDQWGYIDHEGDVKALFDDAGAFHDGAALIVENQTAYLIDENFEKKQELGSADSVYNIGEVFGVNKDDKQRLYVLK